MGEPMHVNSYLIAGSERAVLFDTGMGIANIRQRVERIVDVPVLVVNSHYHFDHVGGNHLFDDIAIHELGAAPLMAGPPDEWFPKYLDFAYSMLEQYKIFREIDQSWFRVLATEMQMRDLPTGFRSSGWRTVVSVPNRLLHDGDIIDLGDRRLTVLHTPGHSPDCICLLDEEHRILFSGDTFDTGPIYAHLPDSNVDAFTTSAHRLAQEVASKIDVMFSAHGARYQSRPDILHRVADAFELVQQGIAELTETSDCFGDRAQEALFNDFSIVVPYGFKGGSKSLIS